MLNELSDEVAVTEPALMVVEALKMDEKFEDVWYVGSGDLMTLSEVLLTSALDVKSLEVPVRLGLWPASDELLDSTPDEVATAESALVVTEALNADETLKDD
jgi:hypothetical protein